MQDIDALFQLLAMLMTEPRTAVLFVLLVIAFLFGLLVPQSATVTVFQTVAGSPATTASLQAGDVINNDVIGNVVQKPTKTGSGTRSTPNSSRTRAWISSWSAMISLARALPRFTMASVCFEEIATRPRV